jgi:hypothetical protein
MLVFGDDLSASETLAADLFVPPQKLFRSIAFHVKSQRLD